MSTTLQRRMGEWRFSSMYT